MKLICPKCLGMKKFMVGEPVPRKCDKHHNHMIHLKNVIEMPADESDLSIRKLAETEEPTDTQWPPKDELPVKKGQSSLKSALSVIPDMDVPILRSVAKKLKIKSWWMLSKKKLITKIKAALKAGYAG